MLRNGSGYRRRAGRYGKPTVIAPNHLQQKFDVPAPNRAWVTDITYIRTHEGWLYLAVVLDLFPRQVIDWSMGSRIDRNLAMDALLMAVWRRSPEQEVIVHSDQGSQFSSHDWQAFLKSHNLVFRREAGMEQGFQLPSKLSECLAAKGLIKNVLA